MIGITSEQIDRVQLILHNVENGPQKVFYNVINRGVQKVRTEAGRQVRTVYNVKQGDFTANQNIRVKKASPGDLVGAVEFAGTFVPLKQFKVTPGAPAQQPVSVAVLKANGGKRLQDAYVADLGLYGPGVFERLTRERDSSQQLFGPSPAHMVGNEDVLTEIAEPVQDLINKRVEHEIGRILAGIGG